MQRGRVLPVNLPLSPRDFFTASPLGLMRRFADEIGRTFSSFGVPSTGTSSSEELNWMPAVEVRETDNTLVVSAELPGISEKDVKVEATDESLVIEDERKREYAGEEGGIRRSERSYGHFWRLIPLPKGTEVEDAKASFENGVLEVTIPVPDLQQRHRQIPITTGQGTSGQRARSASQSG